MALNHEGQRLPCGVELDILAEQVAAGAPPANPEHQARCPHCTTALIALREALGDLAAYGRQPVPVPPGLSARIMSRVRQLAQALTEHVVIVGARGSTQISHRIVAQLARRAAIATPGVLFASAQAVESRATAPDRLTMSLRLVIAFGASVEAVAEAARARIQRLLPRIVGAQVERIDVLVEDVALDE